MGFDVLEQAVGAINWIWFAVAVIVAYGIGAVWFGALFSKQWQKVFKVEMEEPTAASFIKTMGGQLLVTLLLCFVFFVLVKISVAVAVLALVGFCGWEKGMLNFQFTKMKNYIMATLINVGYLFIVGVIAILFGLI
jgi:hypothetical protein